MTAPVSFLWPGPVPDVAPAEVDAKPGAFRTGEEAWVLQTCLRLQAAGRSAMLVSEPPADGILVYHARHEPLVAASTRRRSGPLLVVVRGERSRPLLAHLEIVQNGRGADRRRRYFVPHWPQPGLRPRRGARGERLQRLVYLGRVINLHPQLMTDRWRRALADFGIEWILEEGPGWQDFSAVDAVLAIRPPGRYKNLLKPATKLQNAWLAGVPAILGPEPAFRELRRSDLDFLEARDLPGALDAVRRLQDPELYRRFAGRCRERGPAFSAGSCLARWERLLYDELPARAPDLLAAGPRRRGLIPFGRRWAVEE
ncbi:MAG: hypothetical protein R2991_08010 [Thermoanaerobaculia bacterium]